MGKLCLIEKEAVLHYANFFAKRKYREAKSSLLLNALLQLDFPTKLACNKRRFALYQAFKSQAHGETFESSLSFVLHALGSIVANFAKGDGGYTTFLSLGTGEAGNFVVEVVHSVHASGASVFEFKDLAGDKNVRDYITLYTKD